MKLYATSKNTRSGKKSMGDDTRILIELSYGNKIVGEVGLYAIIDDKKEGYRVVWNDPDKGFSVDNVLKQLEKGKKQKGKCLMCGEVGGQHSDDACQPYRD